MGWGCSTESISIFCVEYKQKEKGEISNINSSSSIIIISSTFITVFSSRKVLPFPLHFMSCHRHHPHLLYHCHWCDYNYLGEWDDCELDYKTFIATQNFLMIKFSKSHYHHFNKSKTTDRQIMQHTSYHIVVLSSRQM